MTASQSQASDRAATLLHSPLTGGVLPILVVGLGIRGVLQTSPLADLAQVSVAAAVVTAVVLLLVVRLIRGGIRPLEAGGDASAWWGANLPRAIALWATAEAASLLGLVAYLLTASLLALGILAGTGLTVLVANRPSQLKES